jgi:hypothetical protein
MSDASKLDYLNKVKSGTWKIEQPKPKETPVFAEAAINELEDLELQLTKLIISKLEGLR